MNRITWLILLALSIVGGLGAQPRVAVKVTANVITNNGPLLIVDGTTYNGPAVFEWIQNTTHTVQFPVSLDQNLNPTTYQSALNDNIRFTFNGWTTNSTLAPNQSGNVLQVIADPSLSLITAGVAETFRLNVVFGAGAGAGQADCSSTPQGSPQGVIYVAQQCIADSNSSFVPAGPLTLAVLPYPGWAFYGYLINGLTYNELSSFNLSGPLTVIPQFSAAKRLDLLTNPLGLQVIVDGAIINTPPAGTAASAGGACAPDYTRIPSNAPAGFTPLCWGQFDFLPGSKHTIGAVISQLDPIGNYWNFSGWSNGLGQNATYIPDSNTGTPDIITANFVPGVHVSMLTNPGGLKLMIDGRDNWPGYNFVWGYGETHSIGAESPQTDSKGRVWTFTGWSDKGDATHNITVPNNPVTGFAFTASFSALAQITIKTSPPGLPVTVDGANCPTPCVVNKASGSTSTIAVAKSIPASAGARFDFLNWSDGSASTSRTVTFPQDTLTLTANFQTSFQVLTVSNPAKGGTFKLTPASADGFYALGTNVSVAAVANSGFKFAHWEGDLVGPVISGTLSMSSPHVVQADFSTVPFIPPAGIQNITGPTPDGTIAPGSLVAIYGSNLAAVTQAGPLNPLAQTIGGVTVTVGDFLLPLSFVSPGQINAQIPWEMAEGTYKLSVHNLGFPDVNGTFSVTQIAPGLFQQPNTLNLPLVFALHPDGSLVTTDSPAVQGEQISIFGTGFGPYVRQAVDGFPAAPVSEYTFSNPVSLMVGSKPVAPDWAGAAGGMVGVSLIKMTISSDMAGLGNVNLTVSVNGKVSTATVLPIQ